MTDHSIHAARPHPASRRPAQRLLAAVALATGLLSAASVLAQSAVPSPVRGTPRAQRGDYIVAVVNRELVTNAEVEQRLEQVQQNAARANTPLPPAAELRQQVLDTLIDERVQITFARDTGQKVDDADIDRAVSSVAVQNQLTLPQLRQRLAADGMDYTRFRNNLRDQLLVERVREHEVSQRIKITDAEVDALLERQRAQAGKSMQYNIAQILVTVPENAGADAVAQRRARAEAALARVRAGEPFEAVAKEVSEDGNKAAGGAIGLRPAERLPDVFVAQVQDLKAGEVSPTLLRTGAGFHVLKVLERRETGAFSVTQTHARHVLLRLSPQLGRDAAMRRLAEFKRQILAGTANFEAVARENSEDGSATQGGDLGWTSPGTFVPEFEEAMNALPVGGISDPLVSRFGVHLIQVVDRRQVSLDVRQQREQARNLLREQKFQPAYLDWLRELRARAYIEFREPPA